MASPYRSSSYEPRVVLTRRVRGLGWPVGAVVALLFFFSYRSFADSRDEAQLECPPAGEACVVTKATGETVRVPEYSATEITYAGPSVASGDTFVVRLGAYTTVDMRTRDDAERFVNAFSAHHKSGTACHEVFRVGLPPTTGYLFAALGLGVLALLIAWRGAYRFVRDDRRGVLRVERASGLVPFSAVEVRLDDVADIVPVAERPDTGFYTRYAAVLDRALGRHSVAFRMRAGHDVFAFPTRLNARDAQGIARAAATLLTDEIIGP